MSSRSGYTVPPRHFENSSYGYGYGQPSSSSRYHNNDIPKLLAANYYESSPEPTPQSPSNSVMGKKNKKKKKHKKTKLSKEDLIYLNDEELREAEARAKEKKKSKRKKQKSHIIEPGSPDSLRNHLRDDFSPPRKKPRDYLMDDRDNRGRHSGSRSPFVPSATRSPYHHHHHGDHHGDHHHHHGGAPPPQEGRHHHRKKVDIPSAYAERHRSPPRSRHRSASRSPNTLKLNQKREKIRKKLAELNREEQKMAEEKRKREELAAAEEAVKLAENERKLKEQESRNIAIAVADHTPQNGSSPHNHYNDLPVPPPPVKESSGELIPGFGDKVKDSGSGSSPNIDAILRSNRENSPENPHYKIDEDEGIKQFKILDKIGEGTYGQVYKARHNSSGDIVALKKVRCDNGKEDSKNKEGFPITAVREIKILKQLQHKNIISLKAIVTERLSADDYRRSDASIYLVFEYMDHDLVGLLDSGLVKFGEREIKVCMRQLFEGLAYCHSKNFLHRDIKCANVLINNKGEVKLADLGLARYWRKDDDQRLYTNKVITRWYRPPELLLGEENYGPAVDIWSSGCILGEMFAKRALFRARSDQEQLEMICRICGTPTPDNWPKVVHLSLYSSVVEYSKKRYPRIVRKEYCYFPELALDLVDKTLTLDPEARLSAEECLEHPFLAGIDLAKEPPMSLPTQDCHEMWSKQNKRRKKQPPVEHHQSSIAHHTVLNP